jgi:hypothetical protein
MMKLKQQSALVAGLLALSLAACTPNGMMQRGDQAGTGDMGSIDTMGSTSGTDSAGAMGSTGDTASTGASGATGAAESGYGSTAGSAAGTAGTEYGGAAPGTMPAPNATVTLIEVIPHPDAQAGTGAMGGSGAAGTTGSATPEKVYRITVRTDQGDMRVVNQETAPTFAPGDRVYLPSDTETMR